MDDVITLIERDHQSVVDLFHEFEIAPDDPDRKRQVVEQLVRTLAQHDAAEEMAVWPAVGKAGLSEQVSALLDAERELREELHTLEKQTSEGVDLNSQVARVRTLTYQHVDEERRVFVSMRDALSDSDLQQLANAYSAARSKAPTRPHPNAPTAAPGVTLAAEAAAPIDRLRDKLTGKD